MAPIPTPNQIPLEEIAQSEQLNDTSFSKRNERQIKSKTEEDIDIYSNVYPPLDIVWKNVVLLSLLHIGALSGLYAIVSGQVMWQTNLLSVLGQLVGGLGITAGAHRMWSHKAYKAKQPLKFVLAIFQTVALQNSIYEWVRDHRVHHKYAETVADPHNAKRGFFFAHIGWLLCRKHPAVKIKGKLIDLSDLEADPIVMFQHRHYVPLVTFFTFVLPTVMAWSLWGETLYNSFTVTLLKYVITLHFTWLVNSAAHYWGSRPYDKSMFSRQNKIVAIVALGEGWHNYHHTFPWDYKTSELGGYKYNFTSAFIDFMAKLGQAYDMKTVPESIVKQRVSRTGDGSHHSHEVDNHGEIKPGPCAWGDEDIPAEDYAVTETLYPSKTN